MAAEITDLYRKRSSLNEFLQGNALNLEIHRLYDKYLKNNRGAGIPKVKELDFFNEVYYQCTAIHNYAILLSGMDTAVAGMRPGQSPMRSSGRRRFRTTSGVTSCLHRRSTQWDGKA